MACWRRGRIVLRHQGIVNRFLGDGIVAVFGAPVSSHNPAEDAVLAALEMVEAKRKSKGKPRKKRSG